MFKIKIKDFQSISDLSLEIKGFTVVIGRNNLGKSAIVRAVDAALTNRPRNDFIRWGKIKTEVSLEKDGLTVDWKKGEKTVYKVNGQPYSGLNRAVPKPITDAGFKQLEIGDAKCNPLIAHQFKELFLINESGSTVTEVLSKIYKINIINDADALCQKSLRAAKSLQKTREADLTALDKQLENFKDLEDLKKKNGALKILEAKAESLRKEIAEINLYEAAVGGLNRNIGKLEGVKDVVFPEIKGTGKNISDYQWLKNTCSDLKKSAETFQRLRKVTTISFPDIKNAETAVADFRWCRDTCEKFHGMLDALKKMKPAISARFPDVSALKDSVDSLTALNAVYGTFLTAARSVKGVMGEQKAVDDSIALAKTEYGKFTICPACKKPL